MARGGIAPFDVLKAATLDPARYLGLTDSLGTIGEGMVADLVLLGANPLDDIRNTRRVEAVVANGRVFDAPGLEALLRNAGGKAGR